MNTLYEIHVNRMLYTKKVFITMDLIQPEDENP